MGATLGSVQPEIHLGPVTIQTFGICFALGFISCGALAARRFPEIGKPRDWAYESLFAGLIGGLVGARVDYVIEKMVTVVNKLRELSPLYEMAKEGIDISKMKWQTA